MASVKRLWSVFTDDMDHCYFTGSPYIERHHIFGGSNRKNSEKYGFVIPLRYDLHPNGARADRSKACEIDLKLKQMAQEYFEANYGTREDFRAIFGKSWL